MSTNYERFEYPNYDWCEWDEFGRNPLTDHLIEDYNLNRPMDRYLVYLLCHEVEMIRMRSNNQDRNNKRLRNQVTKLKGKLK